MGKLGKPWEMVIFFLIENKQQSTCTTSGVALLLWCCVVVLVLHSVHQKIALCHVAFHLPHHASGTAVWRVYLCREKCFCQNGKNDKSHMSSYGSFFSFLKLSSNKVAINLCVVVATLVFVPSGSMAF